MSEAHAVTQPILQWVQRRFQRHAEGTGPLGPCQNTVAVVWHERVIGCRKYREGPYGHVEAQLKQEKKQMKNKGAAYVLGARQENPGVFYVAYIANVTPHKEYMSVTPDGVYFRHEVGALSWLPEAAHLAQARCMGAWQNRRGLWRNS